MVSYFITPHAMQFQPASKLKTPFKTNIAFSALNIAHTAFVVPLLEIQIVYLLVFAYSRI